MTSLAHSDHGVRRVIGLRSRGVFTAAAATTTPATTGAVTGLLVGSITVGGVLLLSSSFVGRGEVERLDVKVVPEFAIRTATATAVAASATATATAGAVAGRGVVAALFAVDVGVVLLGVDLVHVVRLSVNGFHRARG